MDKTYDEIGICVMPNRTHLIWFERDYTLGEFVRIMFALRPDDHGCFFIFEKSMLDLSKPKYELLYSEGKMEFAMATSEKMEVKIAAAGIDVGIYDDHVDYILVLDC